MASIRLMHYVNQFFAGIGGEEKADAPLGFREGPVGPGKRLASLCAGNAQIVFTAYCGDNYFAEHREEVLQKTLEHAKEKGVDMVVAGPAFAAGRYGFACVEVCHFLSKSLGIDGVSGMHAENPGVDGYKQYKNRRVFLLPTSGAATGMEDALAAIAQFISKRAIGKTIGSASEEGYISRGIRVDEISDENGAERAIHMLLNKMKGRPFLTEIPVDIFDGVPVAPPIAKMEKAHLALVSTSGVVPEGNPDRFKNFRNTQWKKYSIEKLNSMKDARWDVVHGGYNTVFMHENPNFGVPLDACRELERKGRFAKLYPYYYGTTGVQAFISTMEALGKEIASDMKGAGVEGALLVST